MLSGLDVSKAVGARGAVVTAHRRLLTALLAACTLPLGAGCVGADTGSGGVSAAAGDRAAVTTDAALPDEAVAPTAAYQEPTAPARSQQKLPAAAAPAPTTATGARAGAAAPSAKPLTQLVLTRADLGDGWLMERPDDTAADRVQHEFCNGPFVTDAERTARLERNFAQEDGTRVQQELDRYASAAAAERAFAEFVAAFESCAEYESSPGLRIVMTPWAAPREAEQRAGVEMTLTPAAGPPVQAALAVYQAQDLLMVLSVLSDERELPAPFHVRLAPAAARRAHLSPSAQEDR